MGASSLQRDGSFKSEAPAICRQIKAQLKEMVLKSHESEVALNV
jgi:hypothetical protein